MSYKKPTIAYLLFNVKNNGGNRVIFEHVNRLSQRGYRVKIFSFLSSYPDWFPLKIEIENFIALLFFKPDILVATFWPTAYLASILPAKHKFYLVQGIESDFYKNSLMKRLTQLTYRFPLQKIAVSSFIGRKFGNVYQLPGSSIELALFKPKPKLSGSQNIKILSVVSSYSWTKGIDLLITAVKKIKSEHPNYFFTLVSPENRSAYFVFDRFVSNPQPLKLAKLYQESDILLSTARSEGFFLPGLEAMASGCILVTTDSGGVRDYGQNKKNCLILNSLEELWQQDLIGNLMTDKKQKNELIQNGYKTVKRYNWDKIIDRLENIYLNCL